MIVIGESINATRRRVRKALLEKDMAYLTQMCRDQDAAGADYIDINVAIAGENNDEARMMRWLVEALEEVTDKPLCIDSANPDVIAAGVKTCKRATPLVNSVNGTRSRIDAIFPLAAEHRLPMIALAMNENGIPRTSDERVSVCHQILDRAAEFGISSERFFFDPLVLPLSTGEKQAQITLDTLKAVRTAIPQAKTVVGLSNISFGLPRRCLINGALLTMAVGMGLDAVILNPTDRKLMSQLRAAELVIGRDRRCRRYIQAHNTGQLED
jgi:5-methyltetrahydrofolate--homocysteine methyltransferase